MASELGLKMTVYSVTAMIKNLFSDEEQNLGISIIDHSSFLLSIEVPFLVHDTVIHKHEAII